MLKSRNLLKKFTKEYSKFTPTNFKLSRALVITKFSRYEFEQLRHPNLSEEQLEQQLRSRGTNYDMLMYLHNLHKDFERRVVQSFKDVGCEVKLTNRIEFRKTVSRNIINWADVIVPVGGDGTFLLAAGRANPLFARRNQKIPIVGFNSDPQRSVGRLMLPGHYSQNPAEAVARIKCGDFKWMHRSRIRTTLLSSNGRIPESTDLYRHTVSKMEQVVPEAESLNEKLSFKYKAKIKRVLPYLALNEVFIGEQLSSRVSHLQLALDEKDTVIKTKCSGLCVSSGTGSTSWHTSINRITPRHVEDLIRVLPKEQFDAERFDVNAELIAEKYNQNLLFAPDDPLMCYSIREQICAGHWPSPKSFEARDFVKTLYVKSHCIDANLVIDGSISYPFNDGAKALLEVYPEDALLTIVLD